MTAILPTDESARYPSPPRAEHLARAVSRGLAINPDVADVDTTILREGSEWSLSMTISLQNPQALERVVDTVTREIVPSVSQLLGDFPLRQDVSFTVADEKGESLALAG
ncbi:hypothetical protein GCM10022261_02420 [Brevibacterium daeguense]|uniref:Uncharacterized protein n=1 Tax=Brevibacterium daeguense TaxID=909936 RepID=A0ABP8EFK5_9MICO|nr:hypothetical protein [Brevibacterium daeguense]